MPFMPHGGLAADAAQLANEGFQLDAGTQSQRGKPGNGFQLGRSTAAHLAHLHKDLTGSLIISIDGNIHVATAGFQALRDAAGYFRARSGGKLTFGLRAGLGAEHLVFPAAIPVNSYALTTKLIGKLVGALDIFFGGSIGEIDGFADGVIRVCLKSGLHADMPLGADIVGSLE